MNVVQRAKNILFSPNTEWEAIAADPTPTKDMIVKYVLPLAAVAAVASFIGLVVVGQSLGPLGTVRLGVGAALVSAIFQVVMAVVMVFVLGFIIDALAPTFGGTKNMGQAVKVAAYAYTPVWVVGILAIIPILGLLGIIAALYAAYLLYLGLPRLMKSPPDKAVGYTVVVIVVGIVVGWIVALMGGLLTAPAMMGAGMVSGSPTVTYDRNSPMGKLDEYGKKMEEATKRMEEAQKSGDAKKQMEAAMGALGTALSGGKGVEPVQVDALKPFVPEKFAGLPRTGLRADRSGVAGLMAAKVEGEYGDNSGKRVELEVVDTGGAAGLMGLAAWAGAVGQSESENSDRVERMRREGNRMVREEISKRGGTNTYAVILGDRFMVSAEGTGVDIATLKSAVGTLDLGKIETLK
ncbi:MAG TPA: Yip1 family protein [Usitatibacter sp.]|nr:Yip1 family protein [Usitatibacter sp.]